MLTTLQDLGRPGYQRYGVSPGGAMDAFALRLANRLVGNPERAAALEITIQGPELRVLEDCFVAITGGSLSPFLASVRMPLWRGVRLTKGQSLIFGERVSGGRAYLSIDRGFSAPEVLGSRSTDLQSKFGGLDGRRLLKGDLLFREGGQTQSITPRLVVPDVLDEYRNPFLLRVVLGPQARSVQPDAMRKVVRAG